jgi:cystathionine beta-lyase/cystathionine gamma-synthase
MMHKNKLENFIKIVLENSPKDWINLTTHRLDIYNEALAKTEFLNYFEKAFNNKNADTTTLQNLPTAYDYIRLGHPLSCVLEWTLSKLHQLKPENIISFSSETMPILAILRFNLLKNKKTQKSIFRLCKKYLVFKVDLIHGLQKLISFHKILLINLFSLFNYL